jgi:hypothetical protein
MQALERVVLQAPGRNIFNSLSTLYCSNCKMGAFWHGVPTNFFAFGGYPRRLALGIAVLAPIPSARGIGFHGLGSGSGVRRLESILPATRKNKTFFSFNLLACGGRGPSRRGRGPSRIGTKIYAKVNSITEIVLPWVPQDPVA